VIYQESVTVPAQTPKGSPVERHIAIAPGLVERVWLGFPKGCSGLLHAQLWRAGSILVPYRSEEDVSWDDHVFDFPMRLMVYDEPLRLTILAWNDDDSYQHRLFCMVSVRALAQWDDERLSTGAMGSGLTELEV